MWNALCLLPTNTHRCAKTCTYTMYLSSLLWSRWRCWWWWCLRPFFFLSFEVFATTSSYRRKGKSLSNSTHHIWLPPHQDQQPVWVENNSLDRRLHPATSFILPIGTQGSLIPRPSHPGIWCLQNKHGRRDLVKLVMCSTIPGCWIDMWMVVHSCVEQLSELSRCWPLSHCWTFVYGCDR